MHVQDIIIIPGVHDTSAAHSDGRDSKAVSQQSAAASARTMGAGRQSNNLHAEPPLKEEGE